MRISRSTSRRSGRSSEPHNAHAIPVAPARAVVRVWSSMLPGSEQARAQSTGMSVYCRLPPPSAFWVKVPA